MEKIEFNVIVTTRTDKDGIKFINGLSIYRTIDELREEMIMQTNLMCDNLKEQTEGHTCTMGLFLTPLIHIIHDDGNENNPKYMEIKQRKLN